MGNPGSNRDAETGTWKLVSGMKIYETSRISIHVSDPLTSWKIKINELLASALWELSFCPELVLARRCYTLTGSSTDTRTARSKWKIGMMKGGWGFPVHQETGLKCRRFGKKIHSFLFQTGSESSGSEGRGAVWVGRRKRRNFSGDLTGKEGWSSETAERNVHRARWGKYKEPGEHVTHLTNKVNCYFVGDGLD